jgi:hypothetical protein
MCTLSQRQEREELPPPVCDPPRPPSPGPALPGFQLPHTRKSRYIMLRIRIKSCYIIVPIKSCYIIVIITFRWFSPLTCLLVICPKHQILQENWSIRSHIVTEKKISTAPSDLRRPLHGVSPNNPPRNWCSTPPETLFHTLGWSYQFKSSLEQGPHTVYLLQELVTPKTTGGWRTLNRLIRGQEGIWCVSIHILWWRRVCVRYTSYILSAERSKGDNQRCVRE